MKLGEGRRVSKRKKVEEKNLALRSLTRDPGQMHHCSENTKI
jgi:hypothetical protein